MNYGLGFMIESLVAILLLLTIGYCVILNRRLKGLRADEMALKATISELITATEIAERAVAGLQATAQECENTLGPRLKAAERICVDLNRQVKAGEGIVSQISRTHERTRSPRCAGAASSSAAGGGRSKSVVLTPAPSPCASAACDDISV